MALDYHDGNWGVLNNGPGEEDDVRTIGTNSSMTEAEAQRHLDEARRAGVPEDFIRQKLSTDRGDYHRLTEAWKSQQQGSGRDQQASGGGSSVTQSWSGGSSNPTLSLPDWYKSLLERQQSQAEEAARVNRERGNALYGQLQGRAQQSLNVDRNDPIIRAQADAYAAQQERARRNYISDTAESSGPYANIQGEKRMAAERMGQATGSFEAGLLGHELQARRQEIAQALNSMAGMLSAEQVQALQRDLSLMDQQIKEQQMKLTARGQDLGNDQFMRNLALNEWDRNNYWDYNRTFGN